MFLLANAAHDTCFGGSDTAHTIKIIRTIMNKNGSSHQESPVHDFYHILSITPTSVIFLSNHHTTA